MTCNNADKPCELRRRQRSTVFRLIMGGLLLILTLVLSGCYGGAVREEIWLKSNDRWESETTFTLTADEREMFEAEMGETDFKDLIESESPEDVSIKFSEREEPDGGISYVIKTSGRGLSTLNENCFGGEATIRKNNEGHISISWTPSPDYIYAFREMAIVIHGNEIISSNANTMEDDTATWQNPSRVDVQVDASGFPIIKVLAIGGMILLMLGLLIFGGGGLFLIVRKQRSPGESA